MKNLMKSIKLRSVFLSVFVCLCLQGCAGFTTEQPTDSMPISGSFICKVGPARDDESYINYENGYGFSDVKDAFQIKLIVGRAELHATLTEAYVPCTVELENMIWGTNEDDTYANLRVTYSGLEYDTEYMLYVTGYFEAYNDSSALVASSDNLSDIYDAHGSDIVVIKTISQPAPVSKFVVTVTDGTLGDGTTTGEYAQDETVTITADAAPSGQQFKEWTVVSGNISLASSTSATTTFTMPAEAVSVKANYEAIPVTTPSITTQPGNVTVKEGETATFTIVASGTDLTYQWMVNRNDGNGWVNIASANAASYTASTVDKSCNGFQYKCVVSNSAGNVESSTVTLTVQDAGGSNPGGGGSDNPGDSGSDNPDTPSNPDTTYQIINGAESSWIAGSSEGLTIRGDGEFSKFTGVKVDGNLVDPSNYTAQEGSTIITLNTSYLNTLAAGTHTVDIVWTDGSASTTFTINANTSDKKDDVPKTGDSTPIAWLFILAGLSGTGLILTGKKGKKNLETLRK